MEGRPYLLPEAGQAPQKGPWEAVGGPGAAGRVTIPRRLEEPQRRPPEAAGEAQHSPYLQRPGNAPETVRTGRPRKAGPLSGAAPDLSQRTGPAGPPGGPTGAHRRPAGAGRYVYPASNGRGPERATGGPQRGPPCGPGMFSRQHMGSRWRAQRGATEGPPCGPGQRPRREGDGTNSNARRPWTGSTATGGPAGKTDSARRPWRIGSSGEALEITRPGQSSTPGGKRREVGTIQSAPSGGPGVLGKH